jgi:Rieske 2Fe-2S family protein
MGATGQKIHTFFAGNASHLRDRVPLPARLQPEYHRQEIDRVFRRSWIPIATLYDLPAAGSYIVLDLPTFKTSLLVARGDDGVVRAFHNICPHRGNKLVRGASGCAKQFTCGFHGWSFTNRGALDAVTDADQFCDLDASKLGLIAVRTGVWESFIFVNFDAAGSEPLKEAVGELHDRYQGYFGDREKVSHYRIEVPCNWNIAINAFTEGYHSLFIHRQTVPDYQGGKTNKFRHRTYLELMRRHGMYSAHANPSHKPTPVESIVYRHGHRLYPAFGGDLPELPPGVNPGRHPEWAFDLLEFFPNVVILTGSRWFSYFRFWPLAHDRTLIVREGFAYKARTAGERLGQAYWKVRSREVVREDLPTMERVHEMLMSGAMENIVLSKQEMLLQHHYANVDAMVRGEG